MGQAGMRASDAERDQAVGELRERFAEGRLSQDTFLYRMNAALRARDQAELTGLFTDLPEPEAPARGRRGARRPLRSRLGMLRQAVARGRRGEAKGPQPGPPPLYLPRQADRRFTIGRALACDLTLADLSVSRWHARLHREDDGWLLSDLGSTNGTRLNGWRVTTGVPVRPGDQVSFGTVSFVIADGAVVSGQTPAS